MFKKLLASTISSLVILGFFSSTALAVGLTGAIFTTNSLCNGTNVNIFGSKTDVYIDGGPAHTGAAGLPNGEYYIQVTEPNGTLLGTSIGSLDETPIVVAGGEFVTCYNLFALTNFGNTSNPGGEYKVWVSSLSDFSGGNTKTDNFKVKVGDPEATPTPVPQAELKVEKFYDANANGVKDVTEQLITGWKIRIQDGIDLIRYTLVDLFLDPDDYVVTEFAPVQTNWFSTTTNPVNITLNDGDSKTVRFGNYCLVSSGGLSKGFWTNKNGQAVFGSSSAADLAALVALNLRNANGTNFNPGSYAEFKTWLGSATATNMANMLSAQLAAVKLDVLHGYTDGSAFYIPFGRTINQLITAADAQLAVNSLTLSLSGNPNRSIQETLKNHLDALANGASVVPTTPCLFSFAE